MFRLIFVICAFPIACHTCEYLPDDAKPKGLEERAIDSEIVLAAYTRAVFRTKNNTSNYAAEFLVFNIIKGEDHVLEVYQKRKPSELETVLNRRMVNVSNFGDPTKCDSEVNPNETYILLLDVQANGELTARYDGAYGPAVIYSRDKETALEAIGSSPWSDWSPCSGSCGGGIQQRKRSCDGTSKCSNEDGQQRACNMFPCTGILNILEAAGVHRSTLHPPGRPSAFKLLPTGSWRSLEEEIIFPRTFPWEFSLLMTLRLKSSSNGGFLLRVLHSGSLQVGLYISDILTLVLSDKDNIRVSFVKSLFDDHWHQLAFSVRRNTVSFYLDCEYSAKLPLPGRILPFGGIPATIIVGSTGDHELDAFQGDVEQITVTGSPDAAQKQCNSSTYPFHSRAGTYALKQEFKAKPTFSSKPQNDQLPLRGDILIDDEDFSFEEPGSGNGSLKQEEDYDDYEDNVTPTKDKIPLKSESALEEENEDYDEDEDYKDSNNDENIDENQQLDKKPSLNEITNDYVIEDTGTEYGTVAAKTTEIEKKKTEIKEEEEKVHESSNIYGTLKTEPIPTSNQTNNTSDRTYLKTNDSKSYNLKHETPNIFKIDSEEKMYNSADDSNLFDKWYNYPSTNITTNNSNFKSSINYDFNQSDDEDDKEDLTEGSGSNFDVELEWSEWSPCSTSCNWGRRTRTSYCLDNGLNLEKCTAASSRRSQTEACFLRLCPSTTTTSSPTTFTYSTSFTLKNISNFKLPCKTHCQNGGICQPPYKCLCPPGYYGNMCQYVKHACKVNCRNGGTCYPPFTCICAKGYFGNECQYGCGKICTEGQKCYPETNTCKCPPGYISPSCSAVCKPQCMNGGACIAPNTCQCKPGYVGKSCHKAICQQGCKNGGECIAPNKCACRSGFSGKDCSQPYCEPECKNGGECVKPYFCFCPMGTTGTFCEKFTCKPECQNGGVCISPEKCSCPYGYSGKYCEQVYCHGGCYNGGICDKTGNCVCALGYTGSRCEKKKPCKFVEVKEPFKRGFKQKVATKVKVPCGAWDWKMCTKTKVHYEMVYKTFYKTSYQCEGFQQSKYSEYKKD